MNNKSLSTLMMVPVVGLFTGCADIHTDNYKKITATNNNSIEDIEKINSTRVNEISSGVIIDDFYTEFTPLHVEMNKSVKIPSHIPSEIPFYTATPISESELKHTLFTDYGIKINFSRLVKSVAKKDNNEEDESSDEQAVKPNHTEDWSVESNIGDNDSSVDGGPLNKDALGLFGGEDGRIGNAEFIQPINFHGSIVDFMDLIAIDRNLSWKYDELEDTFVFFDLDTEVFELIDNTGEYSSSLKVSTDSKASSSSEEGSGDSSSATSQSISYTDGSKHWEDLKLTITSMLSEDGVATFDQKNSNVTVTDTKTVLNKVGQVIEKLNKSNGTLVFLDVMYLKVNISKESEYGLNLSATDFLGSVIEGSVSGGLKTNTKLTNLDSVMNINFSKADVKAIIGAMSKYGTVSTKYEMPITTLNNTPHPYQSVIEEKYVSSVTQSETEKGGIIKTAETEFNKTGLTSVFTPRVFKDNVIVSGRLTLTDNLSMKVITDMDSIALPKNSSETHIVKNIIPNGVTKIVSIQKIERGTTSSSGPLGENSVLLGGNEKAKSSKEIAMVMVTPYIIK